MVRKSFASGTRFERSPRQEDRKVSRTKKGSSIDEKGQGRRARKNRTINHCNRLNAAEGCEECKKRNETGRGLNKIQKPLLNFGEPLKKTGRSIPKHSSGETPMQG